MRRLSSVLLVTALAVPGALILPTLPTLTGPTARPEPVPTAIASLPLAGVDRAAAAAAGTGLRPAGGPAGHRLVVLTAPRPTRAFQSVGVTWRMPIGPAPLLAIQVRTRTDGHWSGWSALDTDSDTLADPTVPVAGRAAERAGTAPSWVGPSDGVQVRVDQLAGPPAQDLKLELVDPGSSPFDAQAGQQLPGAAAAATGRPAILSRAAWGADERRVRAVPTLMPTIRAGMVHHTADHNTYTAAQVPGIIRSDFAYHLSRGWNDIGYNFLVDRFGRIWEGRAGGVALAVMGAHSGGFNTDTFGVSLIGNYEQVRPSPAAVAAIARVFAWKLDLYHRDPFGTTTLTSAGGGTSRYPAGTVVRKPVLMGHRDVGQTACPGKYVYSLLPAIRRTVAGLMKAALLDPSGPPARVGIGAGASIRARALADQSWRLDVRRSCTNQRIATLTGRTAARGQVTATWSGRGPGTALTRAGRYGLTLSSSSRHGPARPVTGSVLVLPPTPPAATSGSVTPAAGRFVPLPPARLLDTRSAGRQPLGPNGRVDLTVLGRGGVPATGVTAVVLSIGAACSADNSQLSAWPAGAPGLAGPVQLVPAAGTVQGGTVVPVGIGGAISLGNRAGVLDVVVDVVGYYSSGSGSGLHPTAPVRVFDAGAARPGWLQPGTARSVSLPTLAGLAPGSITAVLAEVTVYRPDRAGTLAVYPDGSSDAGTTSMIYPAGRTSEVLVHSGVHAGRLTLRVRGGPARVLVDVVGVFGAGGTGFTPVAATRVLDTRPAAALTGGVARSVPVAGVGAVPANATAVLALVTTVQPATELVVTAWPAGVARPGQASVSAPGGQTRSAAALVPIGTAGAISVQATSGTHLVIDVLGYYR
jgi:hypothetical protein